MLGQFGFQVMITDLLLAQVPVLSQSLVAPLHATNTFVISAVVKSSLDHHDTSILVPAETLPWYRDHP